MWILGQNLKENDMKKILVILLVVCMVLSLAAGCSKPENTQSVDKVGTESSETEEVTLSMWIWDDAQAPATQEMIADFQELYPNIKVELTSIAGVYDYNMKIQSVVGTDAAPNVFWLNFNLGREYIPEGVIQDLSGFMDSDDSFDITRLNQGITEAYTVGEEIYAIPKDTDSYAVYYNKALFDQAEVPYPDGTWTLQEFSDAAKATTTDTTIGWTNTLSDRIYCGFIISNGGEIYNAAGDGSNINSPEAVEAIQICMDMMDNGYAYTGAQLSEMDSIAAFTSNLAAMTIDGSWMISQFSEALGKDLGLAELPSGKAGKASVGHGIGYATTTTNENMDETWMLLSYLGSDAAQEKQVEVVIPAANASASVWEEVYPDVNVSVFVKALGYSTPIPLAKTNPTTARGMVRTEVANICNGVYANAQEALDQAQKTIEMEINK